MDCNHTCGPKFRSWEIESCKDDFTAWRDPTTGSMVGVCPHEVEPSGCNGNAHLWEIPKLYFDDFPIELNLRLTTGGYIPLPSGKRLHNELENHHAIHGKIHCKW
jgi:hypothetical protein